MIYPLIIGVSLSLGMVVGLYFGLSARPVAEKPAPKPQPKLATLHHSDGPHTPMSAMYEVIQYCKKLDKENTSKGILFPGRFMDDIFVRDLRILGNMYFHEGGFSVLRAPDFNPPHPSEYSYRDYRKELSEVRIDIRKLKYNVRLL